MRLASWVSARRRRVDQLNYFPASGACLREIRTFVGHHSAVEWMRVCVGGWAGLV